ncbi:MucBP domain-containing protein [Limosilactobacillus sp. RRLNB_1_1]|uniref:MucBP domain-containing protein n=1 Tax=Limosilactobacillus albertensis TaxID=2759752 RepID=A0A7W3TR54_9LACO|nr:MucBP domain-containing protein [Limosilactobacillus albertensis]MBB1069397.1 MucBP domain-containing protein [Limosilactobacillus albertensis]MCD7128385.1 MucBP domain-containing protein [Limosilactobacillus albertensis]
MLSHRNLQEQIKKNEPNKQRFTIKKLSVGVASVLLGVTFAGTASADTTDANSASNSGSAGAEQTDHNLVVTSASTATMKQATAANASTAPAAVVNPAGNVKTPVANDYEATVKSAASAAINDASSNAGAATSQQTPATSSATPSASQNSAASNVAQTPKTETFIPTTTPAASNAISVQGLEASKVQAPATTNENVNQVYKVNVKAVDVTTGKAPVTYSTVFNYNFRNNGAFIEEGKTGTNLYSFGMAPTGYKLLNPEVLDENFTMAGNMAKIKDKDVNLTLEYAPISPILVRYVDEDTGEVLSTSSVGGNTSSADSYAYLHGDKTSISASKFFLRAIDIPGYQLDDQATFVDTFNNIQSKGNYNYQVHTFKYKKVMDNPNPKGSQKGSGAQYGEYFGPEWNTIDPADMFTVSGVQGLTYEHDNGDLEAKMNHVIAKYNNQGYTYMGTINYHKNTDYYNWNEAQTSINLIPNKPVTVKFVDEQGNQLADSETIAFNVNNPDQTNNGINEAKNWYSAGEWHATPKTFDGYTLRTTYGADHGQFTPYKYVVTFEYAKDATAQVKYIDDVTGKQLKADDLKGYVGDEIDYSTKDSITNYESQGYTLVHDGFVPGTKYADGSNVFEVHFNHGQLPVNPDHPNKNVDPSVYAKDVKETVHYVGADAKTPADNVQTSKWSRTVTLDAVTHELVKDGKYDTDWTIVSGQKTEYDQVATPVIEGFHADKANVPATAVTQDDIETTVTYAPNGKIVPVDPTGKPIPDAPTPQYPTEPTDPTSVKPNEPVPDVPGWVPSQSTVTPTDPGKDTPVVYNQIQKADLTIVDQDNDGKQIVVKGVTTKFNADGIENTKIVFNGYADSINTLEGLGYEYVSSNFDVDQTFDNDGTNDQHFKIVMKHGTAPVNPDHPGAGYNKTDLQKDVTRTINYVNVKTGEQVAAPVNQTASFTANGTVDKVTGKLVTVENGKITGPGELTWTPAQDMKAVQSPVVDGMHVVSVSRDADHDNVASVALNHNDESYTVTVSYEENGTVEKNGQKLPVSQTIKFVDEQGNALRENNVQTSELVRNPDVVDAVTGKTITEGSWKETSHKFGVIDVPVIEGYVATVKTAGGLTATTDNPNVVTEVVYKKVGKIIPVDPTGKPIPNVPTPEYPNDPTDPTKVTPNEPVPDVPGWVPSQPTVTPTDPGKDTPVVYNQIQKADLTIVDQDNGNKQIIANGVTTKFNAKDGISGEQITFNGINDAVTALENLGYVYVNSDFKSGMEFDNDGATDQHFTISMKHGTQPVNPNEPGKPGQPINPNDPEGPKYPQGSDQVTKNVTRTIQYVDENGNKVSDSVEQPVNFTAEGVLDKVTGQWVTPLTWSGSQSVAGVKTPVVEGYHVVNVDRDGDGVNVKGVTLTHENDSYTVTVQYAKNGKIIPVDPTGKPIPNVPTPQYPTDPENPAKVTPDEPVPSIPGFVPEVPTVTPTDPGKDTPVHYTPVVNDQNAVVNYVDQDNNNAQIATSGNLTGKPGSLIDYSTAATIKQLEDQGYVLVNNGFPAGAVFDNDDNTTQTYTVVLKHGTTTFKPDKPGTPGEPINPNYPEGPKVTNEDVDYSKDVKFTVHYVGAGSNNPADNVQNAQWTRAITVDNVTGKIISSTEWVSNKDSYSNVATPVVEGYHADRAQVDGQKVTMEDQEATVTYVPNGKIVPVDPTGKPIPNVPTPQYPTDPTDPTKVTPNEPVPTIPNYTPEVPTVTPTDPGVDTPVKYTPNTVNPKPAVDQIAVVNYVDQDNNNAQIATSGNLTGKAGSVINYSTADQIKQLEARGYVLVTDGFPAGATFDDNADQNQVFTVVLKHGHAPVGPKNPEEPGTPVNPGYPEGPKWPAKDNYSKDYTSTVHFVDNNGNKMRDDNVQTSTWTRTLIIDKVTGQILNPNENWTSDKASYNEVKVPVINGYVADKANVPAKEAVQQNIEDTVTYTKVGNIVPVDPSGNRIPNVPVVPYTNDPTDPTKVVPNEPVPSVPGMTPNVTTVTPDHPTVDTPVVYTTPTPVTPQTPATPEPETPAEPARPAETPAQPAAPEAPAAPKAATPAKATPAAKQEAKKLPQTGNENSSSAAALGLAALGLTGLLAAGKKRRKED